jgi:hypothetical protein
MQQAGVGVFGEETTVLDAAACVLLLDARREGLPRARGAQEVWHHCQVWS